MLVKMKSYQTGPKGAYELKPGDITDVFDDVEADRLVGLGGAAYPTKEEIEAYEALVAEREERAKRSRLEAMTVADLKALAAERGMTLGADVTKKPDIIAAIELASAPLKTNGPTVEEWVKAGYKAVNYPPGGYASKSTQEEIEAAIKAQA